ncbi:MAG: peptidoglycan-binding protein [Propionibacteriaceae bacterium]
MSGLEDMIGHAEASLGLTGRPNRITRWYAGRNGAAFSRSPWCNMSVTYWANRSGNAASVCFGRDYAYTIWHAQRFRSEGQWHVDIGGIRRGDIVFFDWNDTNRIGRIDHVGLVTGVRDGVVYTIEGNTRDGCRRRARYASNIVGYGRPTYGTPSSGAKSRAAAAAAGKSDLAPPGIPTLRRGSGGTLVKQLQRCLNKVQRSALEVDGDFGPKTTAAVKTFQASAKGLEVDGRYGPKTSGKLRIARAKAK